MRRHRPGRRGQSQAERGVPGRGRAVAAARGPGRARRARPHAEGAGRLPPDCGGDALALGDRGPDPAAVDGSPAQGLLLRPRIPAIPGSARSGIGGVGRADRNRRLDRPECRGGSDRAPADAASVRPASSALSRVLPCGSSELTARPRRRIAVDHAHRSGPTRRPDRPRAENPVSGTRGLEAGAGGAPCTSSISSDPLIRAE